MMLHWLQKTGAGKPIALMGGGTTRVGDPSGKDESRKLLTPEQIDDNKTSLKGVFSRLIDFGEGQRDAIMVDNAEWLTKLNYIDFLRDVGRHFSVNRMLSFDSVKLRLEREHELSFLEFNYMILQAYDFVELNKRYGCILQMGGSDQWGNIVNGIDLGRRLGTPQLYAVTCPLLTTSSGAKMGKTASGAVWLNGDMLSPYDYWQFWRNTEDADVGRFLKLFTLLGMDEIARLQAMQGADINEAKKVLATEATALLHGREAAELAAETARKTFEQGALAESLPTVEIAASALDRRGAQAGEKRRPSRQRPDRDGRAGRPAHRQPDARGGHQAVVRQETPRAAARGVTRPTAPAGLVTNPSAARLPRRRACAGSRVRRLTADSPPVSGWRRDR
jgi:tyrosyl-tRNA synthetase